MPRSAAKMSSGDAGAQSPTGKPHKSLLRRVFMVLGCVVAVVLIGFVALVGFLTATEYKPTQTEKLTVVKTGNGEGTKPVTAGQDLTYMTWNVGYGALGDNADFFMDGGTSVYTATKERVEENVAAISSEITSVDPDYLFLQEADRNSSRSYGIDEVPQMAASLESYCFAYNFKVAYVPYPVPPVGRVESGIITASDYALGDAMRYSLPISFSWPVSLANLKRCLLITRTPVVDAQGADTDHDLVSVNLHLEAFDSGAGKVAQTKMLAKILQKEAAAGNYVVAGGDFNQSFSSTDISAYSAQEGKWTPGILDESAFERDLQFLQDTGTPSGRSLDQAYEGADKSTFQYYMIDGFIVSSNIEVKSIQTQDLGFKNSDHNPVVMQLSLAA